MSRISSPTVMIWLDHKEDLVSPDKPKVAVLVDYDNAEIRAREAGYELSFSRLREYVRKFGQVVFADVFLSPRSNREQRVTLLWQSGFSVVACPLAQKDKNAVDEQIKARVRQYVLHSDVTVFIIVSEDRDFSHDPNFVHFIRDMDKLVEFISVSSERDALIGENQVRELLPSRELEAFAKILDRMETGTALPSDEVPVAFISAAVSELNKQPRSWYFRVLVNKIWAGIHLNWTSYSSNDLHRLLSAMEERKILLQEKTPSAKNYSLNREHPLVKSLLAQQAIQRTNSRTGGMQNLGDHMKMNVLVGEEFR